MALTSVDLPEPFGPRTATKSPSCAVERDVLPDRASVHLDRGAVELDRDAAFGHRNALRERMHERLQLP